MVAELNRAFREFEVRGATAAQLRDLVAAPPEITDDQVEEIRALMLLGSDAADIERHAHLASIGDNLQYAVPAGGHGGSSRPVSNGGPRPVVLATPRNLR
jgi:hypothetical protein